jgi:hypothetical protein
MIDPSQDAFGVALLDYLEARKCPSLPWRWTVARPGCAETSASAAPGKATDVC